MSGVPNRIAHRSLLPAPDLTPEVYDAIAAEPKRRRIPVVGGLRREPAHGG